MIRAFTENYFQIRYNLVIFRLKWLWQWSREGFGFIGFITVTELVSSIKSSISISSYVISKIGNKEKHQEKHGKYPKKLEKQ